MISVAGASRYWHTLRHLRPVQVYRRAWFRWTRPSPELGPPPALRPREAWTRAASGRASLVGPATFRFMGEARTLAADGWNPAGAEALWLYNLHYFADLHSAGAQDRRAWHRALMTRWVAENPPGTGVGWDPYPVSLRVVNWIKWALDGNALPVDCIDSLAVQARWLLRRLEWHLLGNHLFVNAKALIFAGLFFAGPEALRWLAAGVAILRAQLPEQILGDGGQFERSPMYHALALEDVLDLCNVSRAYPGALPADLAEALNERVDPMRRWLAAMCHPDGEISFFNDAAIGVAPAPVELFAYARRLGFPGMEPLADGVVHLAESGYVRVQRGPMVALLDVAPVGPDHLPGHAHADTLSFELSLHGTRVLVNSGTSRYGTGAERLRQRGTAAHNTVDVDGADSSEVWGGFRVARRARPRELTVGAVGDRVSVGCSHDGYRRLTRPVTHRREWRFSPGALDVADAVPGATTARAHWHWGPDVTLSGDGPFAGTLPDGHTFAFDGEGVSWRREVTTWHPELGANVPAPLLVGALAADTCTTRLRWT